jgi:hypothetical protein
MRRFLQRATSVRAFLFVAALAALAALLDYATGEIVVGVICTVLTAVLLLRALQKHRGRILPTAVPGAPSTTRRIRGSVLRRPGG